MDDNKDDVVEGRPLGVEPICTVLQVAPSTYYAAKDRAPSARAVSDAVVTPAVGDTLGGELPRLWGTEALESRSPRRDRHWSGPDGSVDALCGHRGRDEDQAGADDQAASGRCPTPGRSTSFIRRGATPPRWDRQRCPVVRPMPTCLAAAIGPTPARINFQYSSSRLRFLLRPRRPISTLPN